MPGFSTLSMLPAQRLQNYYLHAYHHQLAQLANNAATINRTELSNRTAPAATGTSTPTETTPLIPSTPTSSASSANLSTSSTTASHASSNTLPDPDLEKGHVPRPGSPPPPFGLATSPCRLHGLDPTAIKTAARHIRTTNPTSQALHDLTLLLLTLSLLLTATLALSLAPKTLLGVPAEIWALLGVVGAVVLVGVGGCVVEGWRAGEGRVGRVGERARLVAVMAVLVCGAGGACVVLSL